MMRSFPQPNNYRAHPLPSPDRAFPLPFRETPLSVFQGSAKSVELGRLTFPFREMHVSDDSLITGIRFRLGDGTWNEIDQGDYPSLVLAVQAVSFTPQEFGVYEFSLEVTAGDSQVVRKVDVKALVYAGQDKVARRFASIKPFFDSKFSIDSSLLSLVEYSVDGESPAVIPATFGTDLVERVKNLSIYWATAGEKKVSLVITDTNMNQSIDHLVIRVSN